MNRRVAARAVVLCSLPYACSTEPTFVGSPTSASANGASAGGSAQASSGTGVGGEGGAAGAGGTAGAGGQSCEGSTHAGHCYVDLTSGTSTWTAAVAACATYAQRTGTKAHLVVIDTLDEDDFVVFTFLKATQRTQDAWIGLTCDATAHPDPNDCFCMTPCVDPVVLEAKRGNWSWIDASMGTYDSWGSLNPNGDGRCAALTFSVNAWSWADRNCDADSFPATTGPRTYRTICEIEP